MSSCYFRPFPFMLCNDAKELELDSQPALGHHILVEKSSDRGKSEAEVFQPAQNYHTQCLFPKRD